MSISLPPLSAYDERPSEQEYAFARSLLGYTKAMPQPSRKRGRPSVDDGGDPHGFVGKRVMLGGGLRNPRLSGTTGVVMRWHLLAKNYEVQLDGGDRELVYMPRQNLFLVFNVDSSVAEKGGQFDQDDLRERNKLHASAKTVQPL